MKSVTFADVVESTKNRMVRDEQQRVRNALKKGAEVVDCGVYFEGGPLILIVNYQGEKLQCRIPEDKADATYAWANRQKANQTAPYCRNPYCRNSFYAA